MIDTLYITIKQQQQQKTYILFKTSVSAVRASVLPDIVVPSCSIGRSMRLKKEYNQKYWIFLL